MVARRADEGIGPYDHCDGDHARCGTLFFLDLMLRGPILLILLPGAGDGEGHGGDVVRDGGAGGNIRAVADRDRRDEVCVAADEGVVADGGTVLFRAVIVDRDRAAAKVAVLADVAVANIGEVRNLRAVGDRGIFDLDEIAHADMAPDRGAGADVSKGADVGIITDGGVIDL